MFIDRRDAAGFGGKFAVEGQRCLLHVAEPITGQRLDCRCRAHQVGGALGQSRAVARGHPTAWIQIGEQFADTTMRIPEHRPAQGQGFDDRAPERFVLGAELQDKGRHRHDIAYIGTRRTDRHVSADATLGGESFEFGDVGFSPWLARAEQEQARIDAAILQVGQQLDGIGMSLQARAARRQGQQWRAVEVWIFGEEARAPFVIGLVAEWKFGGIDAARDQHEPLRTGFPVVAQDVVAHQIGYTDDAIATGHDAAVPAG